MGRELESSIYSRNQRLTLLFSDSISSQALALIRKRSEIITRRLRRPQTGKCSGSLSNFWTADQNHTLNSDPVSKSVQRGHTYIFDFIQKNNCHPTGKEYLKHLSLYIKVRTKIKTLFKITVNRFAFAPSLFRRYE